MDLAMPAARSIVSRLSRKASIPRLGSGSRFLTRLQAMPFLCEQGLVAGADQGDLQPRGRPRRQQATSACSDGLGPVGRRLVYGPNSLDCDVCPWTRSARSYTFRDKLFIDTFPGRAGVRETLIVGKRRPEAGEHQRSRLRPRRQPVPAKIL
jgi:hypothetical protein